MVEIWNGQWGITVTDLTLWGFGVAGCELLLNFGFKKPFSVQSLVNCYEIKEDKPRNTVGD